MGIGKDGLSVIVDGEENPREKPMQAMESYSLNEGDRVLLIKHGNDHIVIGSLKSKYLKEELVE